MITTLRIDSVEDKPVFTTGIASSIIDVNPKTIINYENAGLLNVRRTNTNRRIFSKRDLLILLIIRYLIKDYDLSFDGVKFVMNLINKLGKDNLDLTRYFISNTLFTKMLKKIDED